MASLFAPQIQIVSDLHLETPVARPSYASFNLNLHANYLCLLGDIGLVKDDGLFFFLESLLKSTPNLKIFYVLGNHEPYQQSVEATIKKIGLLLNESRARMDNASYFSTATDTTSARPSQYSVAHCGRAWLKGKQQKCS
jgi:predicted MPP superfamily phosphohydrolase